MIIAYLNTSVNNYFKSYFNLFYFHRIYVLYATTFKIVIFEHPVCSIFQNHLVCFFQLDFVLYSNFIRFARQQFGTLHTKALCMQKKPANSNTVGIRRVDFKLFMRSKPCPDGVSLPSVSDRLLSPKRCGSPPDSSETVPSAGGSCC